MRKLRSYLSPVALLALALIQPAHAAPPPCTVAGHAYHVAQARALAALTRYQQCLSEYFGHNSCGAEFAQLKITQDAFQKAVAEEVSKCGQ